MTYTASGQPDWLTFTPATRTFSGTPLEADTPNTHTIEVTASDGTLSASASFTLTVVAVNDAPGFADGGMTTRSFDENTPAGQNIGDPVAATDDDGDTLTYTLGGTDENSFQIVGTTGQLQTTSGVTYDYEAKSSYSVTVTADDGNSGTATITVTINLNDVNEPPDAPALADQTATEDQAFSYQFAVVTDPEGGAVTYTATLDGGSALPGWLTFDAATRTFSGTPLEADTPNSSHHRGNGYRRRYFVRLGQLHPDGGGGERPAPGARAGQPDGHGGPGVQLHL